MTLLLCTLALTAHADTLADARAAERTGAWNDAAAAYGVLAAEGSGPARRRLDWLAVRQDPDGDWDGLEALDRSRRGGGAHAALAVRQDAELLNYAAAERVTGWPSGILGDTLAGRRSSAAVAAE